MSLHSLQHRHKTTFRLRTTLNHLPTPQNKTKYTCTQREFSTWWDNLDAASVKSLPLERMSSWEIDFPFQIFVKEVFLRDRPSSSDFHERMSSSLTEPSLQMSMKECLPDRLTIIFRLRLKNVFSRDWPSSSDYHLTAHPDVTLCDYWDLKKPVITSTSLNPFFHIRPFSSSFFFSNEKIIFDAGPNVHHFV